MVSIACRVRQPRRLTIVIVVFPSPKASTPSHASSSADPRKATGKLARVLVSRSRETVYASPGDQSLYAVVTNYLVQIQNNRLVSWDNNTDGTQKYKQEYTTELKVTSGSEVSKSIGLSAAFKGLTISTEYSQKTFSTTETTTSKTETTEVEVPPRSELFFYQRQYVLRSDVYFILDAWNELSIVGSVGGHKVLHAQCDVVIDSDDYITTETELKGETEIKVDAASVTNFAEGLKIRKFGNYTERAKNTLRGQNSMYLECILYVSVC